MTLATTTSFFRRLLRLRGKESSAKVVDDPAEMGTAYGLESTMMFEDDSSLIRYRRDAEQAERLARER